MPAPNATASNPNPEGLVEVLVFPNQGKGYGHGITRHSENVPPEGYDRTINMSVKSGRIFSPSYGLTLSDGSSSSTTRPAFILGWQDTTSVPFALYGFGHTVEAFKNHALAADGNWTSLIQAQVYSACFHDDGAGTAYVYVGVDPLVGFLRRRTQAGVWTQDNDVRAKFITSSSGKLWATINDYQIRSCSAGAEPFTLTNWSASIWVGTSEAKITSIGHVGSVVIVGKENGVWSYNEADNRYEPIYRERFHPDNFPFMEPDGQGGIFTASAEGKIIHIEQFGNIAAATPLKDKFVARDSPRGKILSMAVYGDRIYAFLDRGARTQQPQGMKVLITRNSGVSYTDYTAAATDLRLDVAVAIGSMDTASWILVGADAPFSAIDWDVTTANTGQLTLAHSLSTASGAFNQTASVLDETDTTTSATATPWGQSGTMSLMPSTVVEFSSTIPSPVAPWVPATNGGFSKYWWRIQLTSGTVTAAAAVGEVKILPYRSGPSGFSTGLTLTITGNGVRENQQPAFEASGMLPKILAGTLGTGEIVWDDVLTLPKVSSAGKLAITSLPTASSPNGSLLVSTLDGRLYQYPLPYVDDPSTTDYPVLARSGNLVYLDFCPVYYPSGIDMGGGLFRLRYVHLVGQNFTASDSWGVSYRWDDTNAWSPVLKSSDADTYIEYQDDNAGRILWLAVGINDGAATDPIGPAGRNIEVWLEPLVDDTPQPQVPRLIPEVS